MARERPRQADCEVEYLSFSNTRYSAHKIECRLVPAFGIYQRGGQLVRTVLTHTKASDNCSTLIWRLEPVETPHIFEVFSRIVEFQRYDRRSKAWVPTDCPSELPRMYEARRHWEVPPLLGIVHTPQLRADGSLVVAQGYDPDMRLLFKFDGEVFPAIPEHPTKDDALAALKLIEDEISTFPFKTDVDRAVLLSLFLTVLCRRSIDVAPMHAFTAPTPRTGKSLLVSLASILASGRSASVIAQGKNDEEFRKTFAASLMAATPIIAIDNCLRPLTGDWLDQAITEERIDLRVLGHSRNVIVEFGLADHRHRQQSDDRWRHVATGAAVRSRCRDRAPGNAGVHGRTHQETVPPTAWRAGHGTADGPASGTASAGGDRAIEAELRLAASRSGAPGCATHWYGWGVPTPSTSTESSYESNVDREDRCGR